mmetsp:Transcript_48604/g.152530  ORF Transcript_48604/g.152530 Transcript_48604/m.152530 type:complete len:675 (+) Transcript_48604:116-2140(+)
MPEEMMKESARLKTFESIIWPHNNTPLTPQRLAAAGFYAAPTSKAPDRVVCFACENALTNWDPTDDPWLEHQTWYPQCPFVQGRSTGNVPLAKDAAAAPILSFPPAKMDPKANNAVAEAAPPAGGPVEPPLMFDSGKQNVARKGASSNAGNKLFSVAKKGLNNYIQSLQSTSTKAADSEEGGKDIVFRGSSKAKNAPEQEPGTDPISPASQVLAMWHDAIETSDISAHQRSSQQKSAHSQSTYHHQRHTFQGSQLQDYPSAGQAHEKGTLDSPLAGKVQDGWERPVISAESERDGNRTLRNQHDHTKHHHHHHPHIQRETNASNRTKNAEAHGAQEDAFVQKSSQEKNGQEKSLNGARERELVSQKIQSAMDEVTRFLSHQQNEMMERMETKMKTVHQRVEALNSNMSKLGTSWAEAKEKEISSTHERLRKLKGEEKSLVERIEKLQEEMKKHSSDLAKVRRMDDTMRRAHAELAATREEEESLRQELQELKEEVSSKAQQRLLLQSEVVDLKDTVNRRKTEIDVMETKLRELAERESKLRALELDVRSRESSLAERETRVKAREEWVAKRDGQVKAVEAVLLAREKKVREMEDSNQTRRSDMGSDPEMSRWAGGFRSPSRSHPAPQSPSRARPGSASMASSSAAAMPRVSRDTTPKRGSGGSSHIPTQYVNPW